MRRCLLVIITTLLTATVHAEQLAKGDSIYEHMVECSLRGETEQLFSERDQALSVLAANQQWEHYYVVAAICNLAKVTSEGQTFAGLRECRHLYEEARDRGHEYGRGIALAQIGWLYTYIGDHEEGLRQMKEAFHLLRRHPLNRDVISLFYNYLYVLELTGNYKEASRTLALMKPVVKYYEWGDTASIVYKHCRDNLLNAEALLEVRLGNMERAEVLVNKLYTKLANRDEQNPYEALRAIAEYYKAKGDYGFALATTDDMQPLASNSGLQWRLGLLRTEILRKLGRSDEAYDQLRPMIDQRSNDRLSQMRQQLSEIDTMTELDELRIHKEHLQFWYAVIIGLLLLCGLGVFTIYRHRAAVKLKHANNELQEAYNQLEETTTAKERIESELRIARDIQMSMVPSQFPKCDNLDVYALIQPAREVGGDLYDVRLIDEYLLYFCVGDVSGKGVPASLFMAQTIRLFRTMAKLKLKPSQIANYLNHELADENESGMFVTMFIGMLNLKAGHLVFCNCGHNPPVVGAGTPEAHFLEMRPNLPIGLMPDMEYESETIDDLRNQPLFIYTDGLNEAEDDQQRQFGDDRLLEELRNKTFTTSRRLVNYMDRQVEAHRNGASPNDDLTMLCIMTR